MSYLDVPRLHFFGTFIANPSTLNNTAGNYKLPLIPTQGWNPKGSHSWTLNGCSVQTVIGPDGSSLQDPLAGTPVSSAATPSTNPQCGGNSTPKLVDLDPDQQFVSMIFGLQIQIGDSSSGTVTGTFQPQPFMDLYRIAGGGAYYQSQLQDLTWSPNLTSPVLQELQKISPNALSIKFNLLVNANNDHQGQPKTGSITGTIGPASSGEPANFLLGRLMRSAAPPSDLFVGHVLQASQASAPTFNYVPFVVDGHRGKVIVDFGNSLPMTFPTTNNTPQPDGSLGTMQVAIVPSQGSPQVLGTVEYTTAAYQATAAIQEFEVTAEQISLLQSSILAVLLEGSRVLAEDENATYLGVTPMVCRLNPGDSVQIDLVALSFGSPAANQKIDINVGVMGSSQNSIPPESVLQPTGANGQPLTSITTDANGQASFKLTATQGPGNPRGPIDGQVYSVDFKWALASNPDSNVFVSVHVYDHVLVPPSPDWETDVLPILKPYHELYPFMATFFNLADPNAVIDNAQEIACRLQLPETDPRHMPVTRDLSTNKKQIVLNWLKQNGAGGRSAE